MMYLLLLAFSSQYGFASESSSISDYELARIGIQRVARDGFPAQGIVVTGWRDGERRGIFISQFTNNIQSLETVRAMDIMLIAQREGPRLDFLRGPLIVKEPVISADLAKKVSQDVFPRIEFLDWSKDFSIVVVPYNNTYIIGVENLKRTLHEGELFLYDKEMNFIRKVGD